MTYGQWKIHGLVVNTNLQRRWENMSLASNLPITLTDGAVMGRYWHMHISSNHISCLKSTEKVVQVVETMTSCCMFIWWPRPIKPAGPSVFKDIIWKYTFKISMFALFTLVTALFSSFPIQSSSLSVPGWQVTKKEMCFFPCQTQLTPTCRNTPINTHKARRN